jgi:hypothetical protein
MWRCVVCDCSGDVVKLNFSKFEDPRLSLILKYFEKALIKKQSV